MPSKGYERLNRSTTPMTLVEERYDESKEQELERKELLMKEQQRRDSPFLIGTIDEINRRISNLDQKLQSYQELVVESRASDGSDEEYANLIRPTSSDGRLLYQRREREAREINRFAGFYTVKATFTPGLSERVKNISKISMNPSKTVKKIDGKPKFVELHQYPGYDPYELTPLPNSVTTSNILTKVTIAQPKLHKKVSYRPEFERLFYSQMSHAILQDTFWWYFQEKYQPNKEYQMKLFNRIAHNYVKLLTYAKHPQHRDPFLTEYPSLVGQAVYTAFCSTFPDSLRQYNNAFKEDLVCLIFEWMAGVRPAPNLWQSWNLDSLEPQNIKAREELMSQAMDKNLTSGLSMDFFESTTSQATGSQSSMTQYGTPKSSLSGVSINVPNRHRSRRSSINRRTALPSPLLSDSSTSERVDDEQYQPSTRSKRKLQWRKKNLNVETNQADMPDALTPIREFQEDGVSGKQGTRGSKSIYVRSKLKKQSIPVGRGPEFSHNVFNIYGQSPLVAHFMRMKHLQVDAGMVVRLKRTEIESLPPVGTKTYQSLIQDSFKGLQQLDKDYQALFDRDIAESNQFMRKQRAEMQEYQNRQKALLAKPREVKRLADLLILELKEIKVGKWKANNGTNDEKDDDSVTAGASAAVQTALQNVFVD